MQMFIYLCLIGFFVATNVNGDSITTRECSCMEIVDFMGELFQTNVCAVSRAKLSSNCVPQAYKFMNEKNCSFVDPENLLVKAYVQCYNVKYAENGSCKASFYSNILLLIVVFAVIFYRF